ncbi:MAG: type II toxin-antitoxin system VapC family toxin [Aquiluna sp.]|nr:type II toxin-antitoxin system VapC family toxin [Aquiluna sp.]MCF8545633.1 type II toxin-antitoxin system VapC family toxin [Aquiluna sp.]
MYYIDTSAAVKLFTNETESASMREFFCQNQSESFSSTLLITELVGNLSRLAPSSVAVAHSFLDSLLLVKLTEELLLSAADLMPAGLRTLDSIHLAACMSIDRQSVLVSYDKKFMEVANDHGVETKSPGFD